MITFARPLRDLRRIHRLVGHLEAAVVPSSVDLTEATLLPFWLVQKDRSSGARYSVWAAEDRHPAVPWALPPCKRHGGRDWLVDLLRELWLPEAVELLEDTDEEEKAALRSAAMAEIAKGSIHEE